MSEGQYTMDMTIDEVVAAVGDDICRHCLNARNDGTPAPDLCTECGRCYGAVGRCHDSPLCAVRDPDYAGLEDTDRVQAPTAVTQTPSPDNEFSEPVIISTELSITLSKDIDPNTVTPSSVYLVDADGLPIGPAQSSYPTVEDSTITLHLEADLDYSTEYFFHVTQEVQDINGMTLAAPHTSAGPFTTRSTDAVAPTVSSTSPANAATGVSVEPTITITFSEAMNPWVFDASEGGGTPQGVITLTPEDGAADTDIGGISFNSPTNTIATIILSTALEAGKRYKIRVSTGAHDANGNALAVAYAQATGFTTTP